MSRAWTVDAMRFECVIVVKCTCGVSVVYPSGR